MMLDVPFPVFRPPIKSIIHSLIEVNCMCSVIGVVRETFDDVLGVEHLILTEQHSGSLVVLEAPFSVLSSVLRDQCHLFHHPVRIAEEELLPKIANSPKRQLARTDMDYITNFFHVAQRHEEEALVSPRWEVLAGLRGPGIQRVQPLLMW